MMQREDIEQLKEIFVTRQECQNNISSIEGKLTRDNVRLSVIEHQLKLILWILTTVGGGVIAIVLKIFFGDI